MGLEKLNEVEVGSALLGIDITAAHPLYSDMMDEWEKCRDCYAGQKQIKAKGQKYLPKLSTQGTAEYEVYKDRAQFYGATNRTVEAYLGMIFRKAVKFTAKYGGDQSVEFDEFIGNYLNSITNDGKSLNELAHEIAEEIIVTNRVGILVDMPTVSPAPDSFLTMYDYEINDIKPILTVYKTESIINWHTVRENGKDIPVLYVLYEPQEVFPENSLVTEEQDTYTILYLENWEDRRNRRYKMIRLEGPTLSDPHSGFMVTDVIYPRRNGEYLDHIPFYVLSDQGLDYKRVRLPMISDLANVNIGHYRNSADYEDELHFVSRKTIVFPGWDKSKFGEPRVGGALAAPKDCIPSLLQPTSDSSIREEMVLKEARLAVLGAERISQKQRYLPSASVAEITASAEASVIQNFLTSLNLALNRIIGEAIAWARPIWAKWNEKEIDLTVMVNTDLAENSVTGADLVNYIAAYQQGGISFETLYYNLERREVYPEGHSPAKEWQALQKTSDLILTEAMRGIVDGTTQKNPFFRQEEDGTQDSTRQTASGGTGEDVTVREIGTQARVRSS